MSDLIGKLGRELVEEQEKKISISQTQTHFREATLQAASFQVDEIKRIRASDEIKRIRASEQLSNPGHSERLSLQHGRSEQLVQAHLNEVQRIRASKCRVDTHVAQVQRLTQNPEHTQFHLYEVRDASSSSTISPFAHCTSVRGTTHLHRNVVPTVPTATSSTSSRSVSRSTNVVTTVPTSSATSSTSSRSGNVVNDVPTLYLNAASSVPTPRLVHTVDKKLAYNPNLLPSTVRLRHVLMEIALWMKKEVPLVVKCFDAINYKLLRIDVNNIDKLMKEIRYGRLNVSLQNINELGFTQHTLLKMATLAKKASSLSILSYTNPLREVFHMNPTDDDRDLAYSDVTTDLLQEVIMMVSLTMQKLFPTKWANEVLRKLILINVKSPNTLLRYILDETLNPKLKANEFCKMNNTTIQALARATPHFNIPVNNEDTKPWSIRKTLRCRNCKTVACNRKTCTRPGRGFDNDHLCFNCCYNCRTVGCHFQNCPHPIDETRCKRNETLFLSRDIDDRHNTRKTSSTSSLKVPPIVSSGIQAQGTNRQRMAWVEAVAKKKANQVWETNRQRMAWVEEKNKAAAAAAAIASTVSDAPS